MIKVCDGSNQLVDREIKVRRDSPRWIRERDFILGSLRRMLEDNECGFPAIPAGCRLGSHAGESKIFIEDIDTGVTKTLFSMTPTSYIGEPNNTEYVQKYAIEGVGEGIQFLKVPEDLIKNITSNLEAMLKGRHEKARAKASNRPQPF